MAYADFDGTRPGKARKPRPGDPTWKDGKGKGLIGALNYWLIVITR